MANPPAGWHPDPLNRHAQRYWDGNQWTEHVADASGNMTTDPLDAGPAQQDQQAAQQADGGAWGQASQQEATWGSDGATSDATTAAGATTGDQAAGGAATDETVPAWGESATSDTDADHAAMLGDSMGGAAVADADAGTTDVDSGAEATEEPAWGDGAAAAGAAAAAGSVAAAEPHDEPGGGHVHNGADASSASGDRSDDGPRTIVRVDVDDGIVVRHGHVVASSGEVILGDSPHPGSMSATGTGTVWVGAQGQQITVVDVPAAGLTVRNDALVAHADGLDRTAASDGIVGFDGTSVSGGGWVAVAASGGTLEISPVGGVDVVVASLVAWTSDLDVSHAQHVHLEGQGTVMVAAGD